MDRLRYIVAGIILTLAVVSFFADLFVADYSAPIWVGPALLAVVAFLFGPSVVGDIGRRRNGNGGNGGK